ncbi:hypothetical protein TWF106_004064 [Orbilia oligospora]|uniref:Uncharacterized protein n=1 Tax=Orbilia oligospora TaxID=2813651 RepID=A0A6G1MM26_ORBOL|nr:hypothetical protein TWF788_003091 [Orbilia oligospora]KAF3198982.1 hypothetical protein TWF106_004064 [Orbilia oligospora]KAF3209030.1 hypothetical protein TWF679_007550 [Orbilia oligospora]KAF3219336.1 hypothetical protein TWF191_007883 [Orbilia oligospora]KAF3261780.1 hypothetical protein TWF192_008238 [Orbilia oligospora]
MFKMPFTLHTFLAPRKPESFPPLPVLPTNASAAPSLFEDLYLEEDIVFDEVFLDIMGLNESAPAPAPRHANEPVYIPRSDSIVAPLLMARRKASLANCLSGHPSAPFELKNMDRFRQTRSKSVSAASALYTKQKADLLKPLPSLPSKTEIPSIEWSTFNVSPAPPSSSNFTNYSMHRKMSTPNRFLSVNFSGSNCIPIPASPLSPRQLGEPSSL